MAGILAQRQVTGEQCRRDNKAERSGDGDPDISEAAFG